MSPMLRSMIHVSGVLNVRACPTDVLEMVHGMAVKSGQIASSPRVEDCVGCKRCETACQQIF